MNALARSGPKSRQDRLPQVCAGSVSHRSRGGGLDPTRRLPRRLLAVCPRRRSHRERASPCVRAGAIAAASELRGPRPAVPPTYPKHRSARVSHGQQRSVTAPAELHQQPSAGGPRELPKLAVARSPWSALGPHGPRNRWSPADTSGHARQVGTTGHRPSTATTSDGETASDRFDPSSNCRTPYRVLAGEARGHRSRASSPGRAGGCHRHAERSSSSVALP